jgi:predicted outer membrane repeat protein
LYLENADVLVSNVDFYGNGAFRGGAIRATDDSNLKIQSESVF